MKFIFLDIDGVLNSHSFIKEAYNNNVDFDDMIDPAAVAILNKLVKISQAKIVVSSTWRLPYLDANKLDDLIALLRKHGVEGDIVGMTPDHNRAYGRGAEIKAWLDDAWVKDVEIDSFVILDDDNDMGDFAKYLVKTSFDNGLQEKHIDMALKILNQRDHIY